MAAPTPNPAPVCLPPPPGQCPILMQPGCVYPAAVIDCGAHAVPVVSGLTLALVLLVVIIIARWALGSKS